MNYYRLTQNTLYRTPIFDTIFGTGNICEEGEIPFIADDFITISTALRKRRYTVKDIHVTVSKQTIDNLHLAICYDITYVYYHPDNTKYFREHFTHEKLVFQLI